MFRIFGASALVLLFSSISFAQNLTERALFARCYSHLTGKPVPLNSSSMADVKAGLKKGIVACNELLDKAVLDPTSGYLTNKNDSEARAILSNLTSFHRSWFTANTVEQIQDNNNETSNGTGDIYDSTEPALFISRAVLSSTGRYSDIVTSPTGVHGLREDQPMGAKIGVNWAVNFPGRRIYGNNGELNVNKFAFMPTVGNFTTNITTTASSFAIFPKIEVGDLVGVRLKNTSDTAVANNVTLAAFTDQRGNNVPGLNYMFDINTGLGGGILGTPVYIMMNFGHGKGTIMNGALKVPRRWSQTNMQTFMCATLPALRESDVMQYVVGNSSTPFRNASSCVMCHANLDPMGYTLRNVVTTNSDFARLTDISPETTKTSTLMATFSVNQGSVTGWPSETVPNFHRQTPSGRVYFRSFATGALVDQNVANVAGVGAAFAATDDFYQCAAKRYFEYFTGITVSLYDRTDPRNATLNKQLSEESVKDRKFVEDLGAGLKADQSVRNMIKKIMNSDYYRAANYRP